MTNLYPVMLSLHARLCVVIGGGAVAARKAAGLLEAGARVRVVSPDLCPALRLRADVAEIEYVASWYEPSCLEAALLVFACTNDRGVNARVARDAAAGGILANVADESDEGDFVTPAVVRRGDLCLGLTTGGNSPRLAARLRDEMAGRFGPEYAAYLELLGEMRSYIKEMVREPADRIRAQDRLLDAEAELLRLLSDSRPEHARERALELIADIAAGNPDA